MRKEIQYNGKHQKFEETKLISEKQISRKKDIKRDKGHFIILKY